MGNRDATLRHGGDDSDAYVTFDARSVILDLPDDGRVADLLPARSIRGDVAPPQRSLARGRTL